MKNIAEYILEALKQYHKDYDEVGLAMLDYVEGTTTNVNNYLRDGKMIISKKKIDHAIKYMDQGFKDTWPAGKPLYRTITWDFMENLYGISRDNIEEHIGDKILDKGYMSTTHEEQSPWGSVWKDDELVLVFTPQNDIHCFDVNKNIHPDDIDCEDQMEILLPRNVEFTIDSYEVKKNKRLGKKRFDKSGNYFIYCTITKVK